MNNVIYYKHYKTLLLTVSGLLLGCAILIAFLQIQTQQEKKVFEIEERVIEKAMVFDNFMNDHIKGLQQLQHVFHLEFENYLQTDISSRIKKQNTGFQLSLLDSLAKREVSLTGKGNIDSMDTEEMHEIRVGYALKSSLEAVFESNVDIERTYYVSSNQWIMTYPYRPNETFDANIYKEQFYLDVKHDKNINKVVISSIWYKDKTKMLSVGYPIYFKNTFKGMLAIDIKLTAFQKLLDSFMAQYNPIILVLNSQKDILLSDYPETRNSNQNSKEIISAIQKNKKNTFSNSYEYIFVRSMLGGEWQFVYIVHKDSLMNVLLQPIFEIFVIVLIFVLFLIAFSHYLIRRFYILPAGQLVSFINSYAHYLKNNPLETPKVPKIWEPWFEKTKQIFAENKQLIYNLDNLVYEKTLALAKISEELADANHTKDKLFSIISHDLRSPMHSLSGILHLLKEKQIGEEDHEIVLNRLCLHFENTKAILENLLFWANSKIKGLPIEYAPFDLKALLDEVVGTLSTFYEKKKITIRNHVPESLVIKSDESVLKVCLQNLISNAVKYSYERGSINIDIDILDENLCIYIKDSGTGISKDILQELNNNRYVKSTNGTNGEKGTGIGVMLCRDFLSSIKGTLKITSVEGVGSIFCVILPQEVYKTSTYQGIHIIEGEIIEH